MHRQERRKAAREAEVTKRQQQLSSMQRKGGNAEKMQARKRAERERKKVERQLQSDLRQQKAERVRKAKAYEKQKLVDKMNANYRRMEAMKEMKAAIEIERREMNRKEWIRRAKWKEQTAVERSVTPGPGAYAQPSTLANSGGSWGKFKPKSDLDLIIARAAETPAPGEYGVGTGSTLKVNGGTWGKFSGKSDLEERMYRAAQTPGPGEYKPKVARGKEGVAFSSFTPKSELDIAILRAAESPAPGQYDGEIIPKRKKKLAELTKEFKVTNKAVLFAAKLRGKLNKSRSPSTGSAA